ncbi:MAG: hypothetical protein WED82_06495 [Balneolales bacterium]
MPVIICVSKLFDEHVSLGFDGSICILKSFCHYFIKEMPLIGVDSLDHWHSQLLEANPDSYYLLRRESAIRDLKQLFDSSAVHQDDLLFYPNIDIVSLAALCDLIQAYGIQRMPRIALRFIGVLEENDSFEPLSLSTLMCMLAHYAESGLQVAFSAESSSLANQLGALYGVPFMQTPTLSDFEFSTISLDSTINIVAPGSGRPDKGFFRLASICRILEDVMPCPFTVFAQDMPPYRYRHISPVTTLPIDQPEIVMLPCSLSEPDLFALMNKSHIILMPYEPSVYRHRSSAIMADAACMGRPIVASGGCGFSADISRFNLGLLARTNRELADRVAHIAAKMLDFVPNNDLSLASTSYNNASRKSIVNSLLGLLV